jgi:hypothetical protein
MPENKIKAVSNLQADTAQRKQLTDAQQTSNNIVPRCVKPDNTAATVDLGQTAAVYADALGWAILPLHSIARDGCCTCGRSDCTSIGKHPLLPNGVNGASKDIDVIYKWWDRWPYANIGVAAGSISGLLVLDVNGEEGEKTLRQLEARYGVLPHTVQQLTGHGRHILFSQPEGQRVTGTVRKWPGIDIRGDGNYIVVAPSLHKSGRRYMWEVEHDISETPLADAPAWILQPERKRRIFRAAQPTFFDNMTGEKRNTSLYQYANRLLFRGLPCKETAYIIHAINAVYCKPPLPDAEVNKLLSSLLDRRCRL